MVIRGMRPNVLNEYVKRGLHILSGAIMIIIGLHPVMYVLPIIIGFIYLLSAILSLTKVEDVFKPLLYACSISSLIIYTTLLVVLPWNYTLTIALSFIGLILIIISYLLALLL